MKQNDAGVVATISSSLTTTSTFGTSLTKVAHMLGKLLLGRNYDIKITLRMDSLLHPSTPCLRILRMNN